jgi:hypothetical protein
MALGDTTYRGSLPLCSIVAAKAVTIPATIVGVDSEETVGPLPDGMCRALWVGGAGDIVCIDGAGNEATVAGIAAGTWLWLAIHRIRSVEAGTTATDILALY